MVMENTPSEAELLLEAWRGGDQASRDRLFELLYDELRTISAALLRAERNASLSTGDLVNEAVLRLLQIQNVQLNDRAHFLALAARAMRHTLIDNARRKSADKHRHQKVTLVTGSGGSERIDADLLEKSLLRLGAFDRQKADIVELRYFGGMTLEEIAEVKGASVSTVKRSWRAARAWLLSVIVEARDESGFA